MLKLVKKWAVIVPVLTAIVASLCFLFGQAYQRGCEKAQIDQTKDATVELFIARKEMTAAITEHDKSIGIIKEKVENIEKSTARIERTLERLIVPAVVGSKKIAVTNKDFYEWRDQP